jgi:hypothetical protein
MTYRVMLALSIVVASTLMAGCASKGWDTKATFDQPAASKRVGGFSDEDARLYRNCVQHIQNRHQNIRGLTIRQVVDQERGREKQRSAFAESQRQRQEAAAARRRELVAAAEQRRHEIAAAANERRREEEESHLLHGSPGCLVLDRRTVHTESGEYTWYIDGKVTNQCDRDLGYVQVSIGFYDASGNLENSGLANVNNLAAGETWSFKKHVYESTSSDGRWGIEKVTGY